MRVLDIELKNYRKFKEFRCEFHPRFTLLAGENGSGKTSLIKGLFNGGVSAVFAHAHLGVGSIQDLDVHKTSSIDVADEQWQAKHYPCESFSKLEFFQPNSEKSQWLGTVGTIKKSENNSNWADKGSGQAVHIAGQILQNFFTDANTEIVPLLARYEAIKPVVGSPSVGVAKPFQQKKEVLTQLFSISTGLLNTGTLASWFQHYALRSLQENAQPLVYRKVRDAVLNAIHAEDINFIVRDNALELKYENQGWRPFNDLSDGQQRIAGIFCDLALRCATLNSHIGEDCITATTGIVTIDELDLHLHPKWQKQVVGDLLRTFPNIQFIATSHSPFLLQAAFEHGAVVDMATGKFMHAQDLSIEDISEHNMGIDEVQRGQRFIQMKNAAKEYYQLLEKIPAASDGEKRAIKSKLDELLIPFSNDPAYAAWLEMHRHAAEV